MRVAIQTLGCKVNQSESASMEGLLKGHNFKIVNHTDNPDIFIINTCTVTAKSDYQSRQLIRKAVNSGARVIATGCYAQLRHDDLSKIRGLDLIIGNSAKSNILNHINKISKDIESSQVIVDSPTSPLTIQPYSSSRSRAFLKIQDGCNFTCSYCTVPLARGKSRSLGIKDILTAARQLCSNGYKEIVLTGIHIGCYGLDLYPKSSLLHIVKMLIMEFPHIRIRLSSIEPQEFHDDLLFFIKKGSVCGHLHIPLQSGSDRILKAMNRRYTTNYFKKIIEKIISYQLSISVGTDLITGFPGESQNDFNETVRFIEELPISYLHVFPYSKRPYTRAFLMEPHIKDDIKRKRVNILLGISKNKINLHKKNNLNRILDVIVENKSETDGIYTGISDNYLKLFIKSDILERGERIKARVVSLTDEGLFAEHLKQ